MRILILFSFLPIWLMSMMNNLKVLVPASIIANIITMAGIVITLYYNFDEMPDPWRLPMVADWSKIPLFFGTALFSFEAIGLVIIFSMLYRVRQHNSFF